MLFALQSWYVLLVKLLVGHVVAAERGVGSRRWPGDDPVADRSRPRTLIESIESGDLFSALGVTDPWCGEPFGWTVSAWSPALEWALVQTAAAHRPLRSRGDHRPRGRRRRSAQAALRIALSPCRATCPGRILHAAWLAEHVLDQVGYHGQAEARLLDPTCGSGTFLLAALQRWRQKACSITLRRDGDIGNHGGV